MNIPAATFQLSQILNASALTRLDRVIGELRRSGIVLVRSGLEAVWLTAAESLTEEGLETFIKIADSAPSVIVTGQRAFRLGFDVPRDATVYSMQGFASLSCETIGHVADPVSKSALTVPTETIMAGVTLSPAGKLPQTIIAMMKHSGLLPAAMIARADCADPSEDVLEITTEEIWEGLKQASGGLQIVAQAKVPLEDSEHTKIIAFRPRDGGAEHLAIVVGEPDVNSPVLIRIHSECYTGDLLGSLRCDCGHQLRGAIALMAASGSGIILYLAQEGRGIGLINKLRAYQLQDLGRDTVDANLDLGFDEDERDYHVALQMLKLMNVRQVRLLTNNPRKVNALSTLGVDVVERVAHVFPANRHNRGYLYTKGSRGGHLFDLNEFSGDNSKS